MELRQLVAALVLLLISSAGHLSSGGVLADMRLHALVATAALPARAGRFWCAVGKAWPRAFLAWTAWWAWRGHGLSGQHGGFDLALGGLVLLFNEPVMLLGFVLLGRFWKPAPAAARVQRWRVSATAA